MNRVLLPLLLLFLTGLLSSCEYGVYCNVRNSSTAPLTVTVVESIIQDKKAAKRGTNPNPALDSFTLVARSVPGTEYDRPVLNNFYVYTLPAGRDISITSAIPGRLLSRVILTRDADTISNIRHLRSEQVDHLAYYVTVLPNGVTEKQLPQRKR